jgi:hypothetical protein
VARNRRRYELRSQNLNRAIDELVAQAEAEVQVGADQVGSERSELVRQMLVTAIRFLRDQRSSGDLKLVNAAIKELRHAMHVFGAYEHVRKVAVFGSARTPRDHPDWAQAELFSAEMIERGWMVITGAGGGIMEAAQGGAGRERSFGVNIRLPFEADANPVISGDPKCVHFRYFFTRKVTFLKNSHAIVLFPGGFGTHDEGFEALTLMQTGKSEILPVVFVDEPGGSYWKDWDRYVRSHLHARGLISDADLALYHVTDDVGDAVRHIGAFYRNYHSSRYVHGKLLIRLQHAPAEAELEALNEEFADIVAEGRIAVSAPLEEEGGEVPELARLVFNFERRAVGRLRQLIDRLGDAAPEAPVVADAIGHEIVQEELAAAQEQAEDEDF